MALPMQESLSVSNEVYLGNHLCDILDYSCKLLVFKYSYRCKGPQNAFGFTLSIITWLPAIKNIYILYVQMHISLNHHA